MPKISGLLDRLCNAVLKQTKSHVAIIITVNNGARMSATQEFCIAGKQPDLAKLAKILRRIAKEIESGIHDP